MSNKQEQEPVYHNVGWEHCAHHNYSAFHCSLHLDFWLSIKAFQLIRVTIVDVQELVNPFLNLGLFVKFEGERHQNEVDLEVWEPVVLEWKLLVRTVVEREWFPADFEYIVESLKRSVIQEAYYWTNQNVWHTGYAEQDKERVR